MTEPAQEEAQREGDQRELWWAHSNGYQNMVATWTGFGWRIDLENGGSITTDIGLDLFESEIDACHAARRFLQRDIERAERDLDRLRSKAEILKDACEYLT